MAVVAEQVRFVAFTTTPPSPSHYHLISPTKRTREDALSTERTAMVVLQHQMLECILNKQQEQDSRIQALEDKVNNLTMWKAKVRARQLVSQFHRSKGKKEQLSSMLRELIIKYKAVEAANPTLPLRSIRNIFSPNQFIEAVRWLMAVQDWLAEPKRVLAPPMCTNQRKSTMEMLCPQMLAAIDEVLKKHQFPLDYKAAVTEFYLDVNEEVHADVGDDRNSVLMLGNAFISSLL